MLEHIFGSKTRVKLLQTFFRSPERSFYGRELARQLSLQLNAIRRELMNLEGLGVIEPADAKSSKLEEMGTERSKYYRLSPNFFLSSELKALLLKAQALEEQSFLSLIQKRGGDLKMFLLTGFFTGNSDAATDMLLVGKVKPVPLGKIIRDFEKFLGHTIRYTIMEEKEFLDRREIGDKFIYGIFEGPHQLVVDKFDWR